MCGLEARTQALTRTHIHIHIHTPINQEIVFRACMLPLLRASLLPSSPPSSPNHANTRAILLSPLLFGLAHLHHGWQRVAREGVPLKQALLGVLLQFVYTGVFGWFAGSSAA